MKPVLLSLCLFCIVPTVFAQEGDTSTTVEHKVDERVMFQSKVRQLTSYLKENNERAAGILFKDVSKAMQQFISETQATADTASGAGKRKLKDKLDRQRQLMAQFQSFQSNLIRNRPSIEVWAEQFTQTLY